MVNGAALSVAVAGFSFFKRKAMKRIWKMKDGTKIKIKDMADSHIKNCIRMLQRHKSRKLTEMMCMPEPQGEMAQLCVDNAIDSILFGDEDIDPIAQGFIDSFECELEKRNAK